jgi:hypothetical protein
MTDTAFVWDVAQMERHTSDGIVIVVHYTVGATDGIYSASAYGSIGLEQPDPDNIIPFAMLEKDLVIGWVQEKLGGQEKVDEISAALQAQLDEQAAPTKAQGVPWV